jgi:hypothetical protein
LGGYWCPAFSTLGSQVHHSSWGTRSMTPEMWLPQPHQVVFSIRKCKHIERLVVGIVEKVAMDSRIRIWSGRNRRRGVQLTAIRAGSFMAHGRRYTSLGVEGSKARYRKLKSNQNMVHAESRIANAPGCVCSAFAESGVICILLRLVVVHFRSSPRRSLVADRATTRRHEWPHSRHTKLSA